MTGGTVLFFLFIVIAMLVLVILYQQFLFRKGIQKKLDELGEKLKEILDHDSEEKIMIFTDNRGLIQLAGQLNRLLESRREIRRKFMRSEVSYKKMLSNISHDIKTPMTVVLGYLEMIRLNGGGNEMLAKAEKKAQNVMELIDQFFTLAKLEAGDTIVELEKVDVCECCREAVLDFYGLLTQKEFQVEIAIPESSVYAEANQDALIRILFNLISNAVRYGSDGKYLGITIRQDEKWICIDVSDKGKGIEKTFSKTVFDRLFTMEDSRNREIQGNGIGLTIAKSLAVQMGGDIILESEPGVLTVFTVKLKSFFN